MYCPAPTLSKQHYWYYTVLQSFHTKPYLTDWKHFVAQSTSKMSKRGMSVWTVRAVSYWALAVYQTTVLTMRTKQNESSPTHKDSADNRKYFIQAIRTAAKRQGSHPHMHTHTVFITIPVRISTLYSSDSALNLFSGMSVLKGKFTSFYAVHRQWFNYITWSFML